MKHEVIRASVLGYCMGVRRAVDKAAWCLSEYAGHQVYSFGPLIHNESALRSLAESGLMLMDPSELEPAGNGALSPAFPGEGGAASPSGEPAPVVIIRAHGIPPATRSVLEARGFIVADATCPRVLANQKKAASYVQKGYVVIIAGDRNHGEVIGLEGCVVHAAETAFPGQSSGRCMLVQTKLDAEQLDLAEAGGQKAVLISQTTMSHSEYDGIAAVLRQRLPGLEVLDTVCPATEERQEALDELCGKVDGVLIIGGKNSANTQRLLTAARKKCAHAAHIASADDIPAEFDGLRVVGIAAGASTPDFVIDEVEARLLSD